MPSEKASTIGSARGDQGEPTQLSRRGAVLHGRCWKLGEGLEVWTVLYESGTGDIFYADCRPGFRARYTQRISPWALTEYDEEGEAVIHGYCDGTDTEVLFELQNLTEVGAAGFRAPALHVGLCGLAYRARVCERAGKARWEPLDKYAPTRPRTRTIGACRGASSPSSRFAIHCRAASLLGLSRPRTTAARIARSIAARVAGARSVWARRSRLRLVAGAVLDERASRSRYEGVDRAYMTSAFGRF